MSRAVEKTAELICDSDIYAGRGLEVFVVPEAALAEVGRVAGAGVGAGDLLKELRWRRDIVGGMFLDQSVNYTY